MHKPTQSLPTHWLNSTYIICQVIHEYACIQLYHKQLFNGQSKYYDNHDFIIRSPSLFSHNLNQSLTVQESDLPLI